MTWFVEHGHAVSLIVRADATVPEGFWPAGISVVRMRPYEGRVFGRLSALDARRAIAEALARCEPDVLHVHDLSSGLGWLARISGFRPYVVTPWGSDLYRIAPSSRTAQILTRLILRRAALVTANSRNLGSTAIRAGARPHAIRPMQFGVDTDVFRPTSPDVALRDRLGLAGRRVVFAPRQIHPLYDQVAIVRAIPMLPDDLSVVMSARAAIGDTFTELVRTAEELGVTDRLVIVPQIPHDDVPAYLSIADVVVSVPHSDATAVTILEALAAGRPVVATDLPSPREWLDETWPDLLVPLGDPAAIAAAVTRALSLPPGTLQRRTVEARRVVSDRAERGENMRRMEDLYRLLARGPRQLVAAS